MTLFHRWFNYCRNYYELWRPVLGKPSYYTCRDCHIVTYTRKRSCPHCGSLRFRPNYPIELVAIEPVEETP